MLIEFSVSNFRSFRERQTLSLVASTGAEHNKTNVASMHGEGLRLLRSAVVYGPNAAGKSNILRALETLRQLVQNSATKFQEGQPLGVRPFLFSQATASQTSEFEIQFLGADTVRYHYFCAVTSERVWKEWLVAYPKGRSQRWYEREYNDKTSRYEWWFGPNFKGERSERKVWQDFTRANALFFSTAIQLNNSQLRPAFTWLTKQLIVLTAGIDWNPQLSLDLLGKKTGQAEIMRFMRAADIGIDRLELKEVELRQSSENDMLAPGSVRIKFEVAPPPGAPPPAIQAQQMRVLAWHKRIDAPDEVPLDIGEESDGTQRLFQYTGGWIHALENGATLFVDELDRSLHPHMTRFLVGLFHGPENERNAQLIFTTHDTTLLDSDLLRRDQVWFVEKDKNHSSHLYSLLEYRPRKDEALERGYLKGRYGAIPFIGSLEV